LRFFESACKSEFERASWIAGFDVFAPTGEESDSLPSDWLPNEAGGYDSDIALEYRGRIVCEIASGGDLSAFEKLYYDTPVSEVWNRIAVMRAVRK
jgi:hypothetical protein